jgi:hypothetical protein
VESGRAVVALARKINWASKGISNNGRGCIWRRLVRAESPSRTTEPSASGSRREKGRTEFELYEYGKPKTPYFEHDSAPNPAVRGERNTGPIGRACVGFRNRAGLAGTCLSKKQEARSKSGVMCACEVRAAVS